MKKVELEWASPDEDTPTPGKIVLAASKSRDKTKWEYCIATFTPEGNDDEGDYYDEHWDDDLGDIEIDTPDFWAYIEEPEAIGG